VLIGETVQGDVMPGAAAAAGLGDIASELAVYEKVLQVLSTETNKLLDQMKTSDDHRQQHKSMLDSINSRVGLATFSRVEYCDDRVSVCLFVCM